MSRLTTAESLKFDLLSDGLSIDEGAMAYIDDRNQGRALTPADYASTSGVILRLDGDVWVNAPIGAHNPNFVDAPTLTLSCDADGLYVHGIGTTVRAEFWLPPAFHDELNSLTLGEGSEAFHLNFGLVKKHVSLTFVRRDKTKPFAIQKLLY